MDKTREQTAATKAQSSKVQTQAREVTNVAKGAAQASERQQAAFVTAKAKAEEAEKAGEKAKAAFRCAVVWCGRVVQCVGVACVGLLFPLRVVHFAFGLVSTTSRQETITQGA